MVERDYDEFAQLLDDAYDLIGTGANKIISGGAKGMFFAAMSAYSLQTVRAALSAHCMDKNRGRFTPKPADLIEQIEASALNDGRPGAEEAWAIALTSRDEADTVVWTTEIAEAFALCQPILSLGDEVGARMAFKEAYTRIVANARGAHQPARWVASLGWDVDRRTTALKKASVAGLLSAPEVAEVYPMLEGPAKDDAKAHEQIARIKQMMADMNAERQRESDLHFQRELDATANAKRDADEKVAKYRKDHGL